MIKLLIQPEALASIYRCREQFGEVEEVSQRQVGGDSSQRRDRRSRRAPSRDTP